MEYTDGVDVDIRYSFRITHTEPQSHRVTDSSLVANSPSCVSAS